MNPLPETPLRGASPACLHWLTGKWTGRAGEAHIEEHWTDCSGNMMMGMFRWVEDDAVKFYEIEALEQEGDLVYMRVKHFDPGLLGWEERDDPHNFLLMQVTDTGAIFREVDQPESRWVVYERHGANRLRINFTVGSDPLEPPGVFELLRE